ncbi:MAG: hypothetical protein BGO23_06510 [Solirubrobacterales bacterium 67-14]|nr:MAG: hypothetical protein BGO23_06510 [Solirubrobacterales bacterium 67-14]
MDSRPIEIAEASGKAGPLRKFPASHGRSRAQPRTPPRQKAKATQLRVVGAVWIHLVQTQR